LKIQKILFIQRRKATIHQVVDVLKEKILRWRKFTRTTLVNALNPDAALKYEHEKKRE